MTTTIGPTTTQDESLDDMMDSGAGSRGPKHYFGQIAILDVWDCVLRKGQGKVPFDPTVHPAEQRNVAITMKLVCTKNDGTTYDLDQNDLASGDKYKVTLTSLKALGVTGRAQLMALAGTYVQAVRVDTGGFYLAKKASADGKIQPGDRVAEQGLQILALYDTAEACKAAEEAFYAPRASQVGDGRNVPEPLPAEQVDTQARAMLLKSLPMLWQAAGQNQATFAAMLDNPNMQFKALGIVADSDEVQTAIGQIPF